MAELPKTISQVNLGAPNISSGSAYHYGIAPNLNYTTHQLDELDKQIKTAEWRTQASEQYAKDVMSYSAELQDLKAKVTDPNAFQVENQKLAEKYLFGNDKELNKVMHPRAMQMYKESMTPYITSNFKQGQEDAFKARAQGVVSGLLNAIDTNIADATAQGMYGINLKDHVARMEENIDALPAMYVDKEKVRTEKRQQLFRALGEAHAREHPFEALEMITTPGSNGEAKFVIKVPKVNPDGSVDSLEDDILKMDPLMNQHLYTVAIQAMDKQNSIFALQRTQSEQQHKYQSEVDFTKAVTRILKGEPGVVDELVAKTSSFQSTFPDARPSLDGGQLNQLREMESTIKDKKAKGEPTTKAGYAKAIDMIYRGNPSFDSIAGVQGVDTNDSVALMGRLFSEKEKLKDTAYSHYKTERNEAEDTIRAMVLAKNPMAAFGEINPVAELLISKFRNTMDEKEKNLLASKAGGDAWRKPDMNPKTIAMQMLADEDPKIKQTFEHDADKLVRSLVPYLTKDKMSYADVGKRIKESKEPEATKKMMLALLLQAHAQKVPESQFTKMMTDGTLPGEDKPGVRKESWYERMKQFFMGGGR